MTIPGEGFTRGGHLRTLAVILAGEKLIQHSLTALFFLVPIRGVGTPSIGTRFDIDNSTMALLNIAFFLAMFVSFVGFLRRAEWGRRCILALALLDIALEFLFHGLFFITVSVLVSTVLSIATHAIRKQRVASMPAS